MLLQNELESITVQFDEADAKLSGLSKQVTSLESQLADTQDLLQEETRQKLSVQGKLRSTEEEINALRDQVDEEEEQRKQLEQKVQQANMQVWTYTYTWFFCLFTWQH